MTLPTLYKLSDAANALGPGAPCEDTLRNEVKAGRLVAKRIGRCLRVTDIELTRWALDTRSAPPSTPSDGFPPGAGSPLPASADGRGAVS